MNKEDFLSNRRKKVDINAMKEEDFQNLMTSLGDKLRGMVDDTCEKGNKLLSQYGLKVKMAIVLETEDGSIVGQVDGTNADKGIGE